MRRFFLKEYGSWGVVTLSFAAGLVAVDAVTVPAAAALLALYLLINAKQAFTIGLREQDTAGKAFSIFLLQVLAATAILVSVFGESIVRLLPVVVVPICYLVSLRFLGEHSLVTEITGFALLTLAAPVAAFAVSGYIDLRLSAAVALFFVAGVFRVRLQFRKRRQEQAMLLGYLAVTAAVYRVLDIPLALLLPLLDNLIFGLTIYRATLSGTGWIEMTKGVIFVLLVAVFF